MRKNIIVVSAVLLLVLITGLIYYFSRPNVEVVLVTKGGISEEIEETGYIQTSDDYDLQAPSNGRIIQLNVSKGDPVTAGQVILVMQNLDLEAQLATVNQGVAGAEGDVKNGHANLDAARLDLDEANKDLKRKTSLRDSGAISKTEYDAALNNSQKAEINVSSLESGVRSAEGRLAALKSQQDSLNAQVNLMEITVPIDGKILALPYKTGQVLAAGTTVASLGASGSLEVTADVLSSDVVKVKVGQPVDISFTGQKGLQLTGRIKEVYPQAHEKISSLGVSERRVTVITALDKNGPLQPGYEVRMTIHPEAHNNTLVLPREAMVAGASGEDSVRVVSNGRVTTRPVTTGLKNSLQIEIVDGLAEGDQVLRDGSLRLQDGDRVRVQVVKG